MCNRTNRAIARAAIALAACAVCTSIAGGATVLYVDDDAPAGGDGLTWDTAFRYLQDALYAAQPGSGIEEIRIGQGLYKPDQDEAGHVTPGDRAATFQLIPSVTLMGGYAGFGASDPDQRDIQLYETMLSGDLLGDDPPDEIISDENSYHVVTYLDEGDEPATLDGLTITHGLADGEDDEYGGGVFSTGPLSLSACSFRLNNAIRGGAIWSSSDWQLTAADSVFTANHATGRGGAVYALHQTTFEDCHFEDNSSDASGGAIMFSYLLSAARCVFEGNAADLGGAAVCALIGDVDIVDCVFRDNEAGYDGGAISLKFSPGDPSFISGCLFKANRAWFGGAVFADWSPLTRVLYVSDCQFLENIATDEGGAMSLERCDFEISDCVLTANTALAGGGVAIWDDSDGEQIIRDCVFTENGSVEGSAVYCRISASPSLTGCVFSLNVGDYGAAVRCSDYAETTLMGCRLTDNTAAYGGAIYVPEHGILVANACEFDGNCACGDGGAISCDHAEKAVLDGCVFSANTAQNGGAVWALVFEESYVTQCTFRENLADASGGAIFCRYWGNSELVACEFARNCAGESGGAIFNSSGTRAAINCLFVGNSAGYGGGLYNCLMEDAINFTNCTLSQNSAAFEGGAMFSTSADPVLSNCIVWGNTPDQVVDGSDADATARYCDIEGGWQGVGEHNIDVNPRFVNPPAGDYRLRPGSPCIDAGNNEYVWQGILTDLDGNPRFHDDLGVEDTGFGQPPIVDIGAYEVQTSSCPTDVNNDGTTDLADIIALLEAWGECDDPYDCPEDVDFDGRVNIDDLFAILGAWGPCP